MAWAICVNFIGEHRAHVKPNESSLKHSGSCCRRSPKAQDSLSFYRCWQRRCYFLLRLLCAEMSPQAYGKWYASEGAWKKLKLFFPFRLKISLPGILVLTLIFMGNLWACCLILLQAIRQDRLKQASSRLHFNEQIISVYRPDAKNPETAVIVWCDSATEFGRISIWCISLPICPFANQDRGKRVGNVGLRFVACRLKGST